MLNSSLSLSLSLSINNVRRLLLFFVARESAFFTRINKNKGKKVLLFLLPFVFFWAKILLGANKKKTKKKNIASKISLVRLSLSIINKSRVPNGRRHTSLAFVFLCSGRVVVVGRRALLAPPPRRIMGFGEGDEEEGSSIGGGGGLSDDDEDDDGGVSMVRFVLPNRLKFFFLLSLSLSRCDVMRD